MDPADDQFNMDEFSLAVHGFAFTHLDALSHVFYKDKMYNGVPESSLTASGAAQLSVDVYRNGIISRGVIVDIPRLKGLRLFKSRARRSYPEDLDAWEKKTGVKIASGDVVFVRTGRWAHRNQGAWDIGARAAGLDASVASWFKRSHRRLRI